MVAVACVWTGKEFGPEYVVKLRNMVQRNLRTRDYQFWVICDSYNAAKLPYGVSKHIISAAEYPKWWGKMKLFDETFQILADQDILYFDLDTIICKSISWMTYQKEFTILENFLQPPLRHPSVTPCKFGSAIIYIPKGYGHHIHDTYYYNQVSVQEEYARDGDQYFIEQMINQKLWEPAPKIWQNEEPGFFRSIKYPEKLTSLPKGCGVVCYHGNPRPSDDSENEIVKEWWI